MNCYVTLTDVKAALGMTSATTTDNAMLLDMIEQASRGIDDHCDRHFYIESATRYFDTMRWSDLLLVDDLLTLTTLTTDSEGDGTYDGETWTEDTDFWVGPYNTFPKTAITTTSFGDYAFPESIARYVEIAGVFGFGDGRREVPFDTTAITVTVATGTGTTLTLSADDIIEPGHTIRVGTEDMFISAVATGTATAERGVNGSTAAVHATAAASIAIYPPSVVKTARQVVVADYKTRMIQGFETEGREGYTTTVLRKPQMILERGLGRFRRLRA